MTLDELSTEFKKDSAFTLNDYHVDAMEIPKLLDKYQILLKKTKNKLEIAKHQYNKLKLQKREFYTDGPSKETQAKGWKFPAKGKIIKTEVDNYLLADDDIIKISLEISDLQETIELIQSYCDHIKFRNNIITNIISWKRFLAGC